MDNASFLQDLFGMQGQVAVVVGGAITRPAEITARFTKAISEKF